MATPYHKMIAGGIALLVCAIGGWTVWPTPYRYEDVKFGESDFRSRIHRVTNRTEILTPNGWMVLEPTPTPPPIVDLPETQTARITGRGQVNYTGFFDGVVYNGSDWRLKELVLHIEGRDRSGQRWSRQFRQKLDVEPLASANLLFLVGEASNDRTTFAWTIDAARGYPDSTLASARSVQLRRDSARAAFVKDSCSRLPQIEKNPFSDLACELKASR